MIHVLPFPIAGIQGLVWVWSMRKRFQWIMTTLLSHTKVMPIRHSVPVDSSGLIRWLILIPELSTGFIIVGNRVLPRIPPESTAPVSWDILSRARGMPPSEWAGRTQSPPSGTRRSRSPPSWTWRSPLTCITARVRQGISPPPITGAHPDDLKAKTEKAL